MFRPQEQTRPSAYTFEREGIANPCDTYKRVHHFIIKYDVFMDGSKINVYHWEFSGLEESF